MDLSLEEGATVGDALGKLGEEPGIGQLVSGMGVRVAVNREYASPERMIADGDELALIPPVSGGEDGIHVRVGSEPISLEAVTQEVARPDAGAVVTFAGLPRDVAALEYEAYVEMAETTIAEILRRCVVRHGLSAAAAEHRVGSVPAGQASVVVAASAAHRAEAFAGAREAIDLIKSEAEIWKREVERGG